jgi:phosphoglycolate phosphatase-like HAD superfamily hydrolase
VYQQTLKYYSGRAFTADEVTAHFGLSEEGIFRRLLPESYWHEAMTYYFDTYTRLHNECNEPFAAIPTALQMLQERKIAMGVITGKGMRTALYTLDYLGIASYFDAVEAGQSDAIIKATAIQKMLAGWNIDPEHAAYIGDADTDMQEAARAGVLPLAAAWAETATIHRLDTLKPHATFTTIDDFIRWIEQHIPLVHV